MNKQQWWGCKHINGSLQAKRYFSYEDISEAEDSSFCEKVVGPFDAENRDEALKIVESLTK